MRNCDSDYNLNQYQNQNQTQILNNSKKINTNSSYKSGTSNLKLFIVLIAALGTAICLLYTRTITNSRLLQATTDTTSKTTTSSVTSSDSNIKVTTIPKNTTIAITNQYYQETCVLKKTNVTEYMLNSKIIGFTNNIKEFIEKYNKYDSDNLDLLQDLMTGKGLSFAVMVETVFKNYVIMFSLACFTFVSWFTCCLCIKKSPACCTEDQTEDTTEGKEKIQFSFMSNSFLIFFTLSLICVIVACIFGFLFSKDFSPTIDNFNCGLIKYYIETKYGVHNLTTPRWNGVQNLTDDMIKISNAYSNIKINKEVFAEQTWIDAELDKFKERLDVVLKEMSDGKVSNPNPESSQKNIVPDFIKNLGPYTDLTTNLGMIYDDYIKTIVDSNKIFLKMKQQIEQLEASRNSYEVFFKELNNGFKTGFEDFGKLETKYISPFQKYKKDYQPLLSITINVLYPLILIFDIAFFSGAVLFSVTKKEVLKNITTLMWNLVVFITMLNFLLATCFGLAGTSFIYITGVIDIIFDPTRQAKILGDGIKNKVYHSCLYRNESSLENVLLENSSEKNLISYFGTFLEETNSLIKNSEKVNSQYEISYAVETAIKLYEKRKTNVLQNIQIDSKMLTRNQLIEISTEAGYAINELNKYTNVGTNTTYQLNCGGTNTYDVYLTEEWRDICPVGYAYLKFTKNTPNESFGKKVCYNVNEWNITTIKQRYTSGPKGCNLSKYGTVSEAAEAYIKSINKYRDDSIPLLTNLQKSIKGLNNDFELAYDYLRNPLNKVKDVILPFYNIFTQIGENFIDIFDCSKLFIIKVLW